MREISELRGKIDKVDNTILTQLEKRARIAKKIGDIKRGEGMQIEDLARESEIISNLCSKTSLDQKFVKKLFRNIIDYCKKNE